MATVADLETQLATVEAAIHEHVTRGESFTVAGRSKKRASLSELRSERDSLLRRIRRLKAGGGPRVRYVIPIEG